MPGVVTSTESIEPLPVAVILPAKPSPLPLFVIYWDRYTLLG